MVIKIVSGLSMLPTAKVIDTFSRVHGLLVSTAFIILGLLIQAAAQNIAVAGAAQIIYGFGWSSLGYIFTVLIADMTSLKNRGTCFLSHPL